MTNKHKHEHNHIHNHHSASENIKVAFLLNLALHKGQKVLFSVINESMQFKHIL